MDMWPPSDGAGSSAAPPSRHSTLVSHSQAFTPQYHQLFQGQIAKPLAGKRAG
jgi:hypothetical protein